MQVSLFLRDMAFNKLVGLLKRLSLSSEMVFFVFETNVRVL